MIEENNKLYDVLTCEDSYEYKTMEKINFKADIHCFTGCSSDLNNYFLVENDDNNIKGDDIIVFLNKKERIISFHNICLITSNVKINFDFKKVIYYDNSFYNMDYESWKIRVDKKLVFNKDTPTKLDEESKYLILKKLTLKPLILDINDFILFPHETSFPAAQRPSMSPSSCRGELCSTNPTDESLGEYPTAQRSLSSRARSGRPPMSRTASNESEQVPPPAEINEEIHEDIYEPLLNFDEGSSPLLYKETYSSSTDSQRSLYHIDFSRKINISEKQSLTI